MTRDSDRMGRAKPPRTNPRGALKPMPAETQAELTRMLTDARASGNRTELIAVMGRIAEVCRRGRHGNFNVDVEHGSAEWDYLLECARESEPRLGLRPRR